MINYYQTLYKQMTIEYSYNLPCLNMQILCNIENGLVYFIKQSYSQTKVTGGLYE